MIIEHACLRDGDVSCLRNLGFAVATGERLTLAADD